jgi:hypothetical protein
MPLLQVYLPLKGNEYLPVDAAVIPRYHAGVEYVTHETPLNYEKRIAECDSKYAFRKEPVWIDTGV